MSAAPAARTASGQRRVQSSKIVPIFAGLVRPSLARGFTVIPSSSERVRQMDWWKERPVRPAAISATVLLVALASAGTASAAFRGSNGRIVFRTNLDGNAEVYTMNADGSGRVDLSRNPAEDVDPRWSPDGSRIVFASNRNGGYDVYTMAADGNDLRRLTFTGNNNRRPTWTADGHILFHAGFFLNRAIFRMNADGSGVQQLTPASSDNAYPAGAPVGARIAFSSIRDGTQRLYTMNADGGAVQLVTPAPPGPETSDVEANWSPRGNDLVFVRFDSFNGSDLYVVHSDGSGLRRLTNTPDRVEFEPAWSPDGTKIVFHACSGLGTSTQHCVVYVINSDGTGETEISTPSIPYLDPFSGDRLDPFLERPVRDRWRHARVDDPGQRRARGVPPVDGTPRSGIGLHLDRDEQPVHSKRRLRRPG